MSRKGNMLSIRDASGGSGEKSIDGASASSTTIRLVLGRPLLRSLTSREARELVAQMRFPDDLNAKDELLSGPISLSAREFTCLFRADQLKYTLDKLSRMERHYREVATLEPAEVKLRLERAPSDDPGTLAYKNCLVGGADPRLKIAQRILSLIPVARRHLEEGKPAPELADIVTLNQQANMSLYAPHIRRGLNILKAGREGGRRKNSGARDAREDLALEFLDARQQNPALTQKQFLENRHSPVSVKTLQRALKDFAGT